MARRYPKIPHVTLSDKGAGKVINITFLDPREPDPKDPKKPKPKCKSTKTTNAKHAERIAWQVSDIITNNQFDDPPAGTLSDTLRILNIKMKDKDVDDQLYNQFMEQVSGKRESKPTLREILDAIELERPLPSKEFLGRSTQREEDVDLREDELELIIQIRIMLKEIHDLKARITSLNTAVLNERDRANAMEAQLLASGHQKAKYGQIVLSLAVENFLSDDPAKGGCRSNKKRWKDSVTKYLENFKNYIGANVKLNEIEADRIIDYLALKMKTAKPKSVKQIGDQILRLIRHQSKGTLTATIGEVKEWIRSNCTVEGKTDFYWPTSDEVNNLLAQITHTRNQYWHDVAMIQYACGFRPEELPFIQAKNVLTINGVQHIRIDRLFDYSGEEYWSPKNVQSIDTVPVPRFARKAVARRLALEKLVLFPRSYVECGGRRPRALKRIDPFMKEHSLWDPELFCQHYIKILREAGKAAGLDAPKMDSRTLRRVCGKEILLQTGSYEKTAAVLRNDPETCRRWYAQFKAPDVSTERDTAVGKDAKQSPECT